MSFLMIVDSLPSGTHVNTDLAYRWPKIQHIDVSGSTYTSAAFKVLVSKVVSITFSYVEAEKLGEVVLLGTHGMNLKRLHIKSGVIKDGEIYYILKRLTQLECL